MRPRHNVRVIAGIEHTAIAARDAASLAAWYRDTLGFEIVYQSANAFFVRAANGVMIEIIHAKEDRGEQTMATQGIRHIALSVADFDGAYAALQSKNVAFAGAPLESKGNRVVFFTDPEGNYLHLLYRPAPLA